MNLSKSMPMAEPGCRVAVIGAGIVGACSALQLRRAGFATTVFERSAPGSGTTSGNGALISVDSVVPIALPNLVRQLPSLLFDRNGPLSLSARDLPAALPWLARLLLSSRWTRVRAISAALHALHRPALDGYRELLGEAFDGLVRPQGQAHVWESEHPSANDRFEALLRAERGADVEVMDAHALRERLPGLAPAIRRGVWFPRHAHTLDPQALAQTLVQRLQAEGGHFVGQAVHALKPRDEGGLELHTDTGSHRFDHVVVAAGIDANRLLVPLGVRLPLQAERGYHVQLGPGTQGPPVPVLHRQKGFVLTPTGGGLRIAGFVEIARADRPADPQRHAQLEHHARAMWPALRLQGERRYWMGSRPSTPDSLPILGPVTRVPGLLLACGHGHFGLTGAYMSGRLVCTALTGQPPPIDPAPYALSRFH